MMAARVAIRQQHVASSHVEEGLSWTRPAGGDGPPRALSPRTFDQPPCELRDLVRQ